MPAPRRGSAGRIPTDCWYAVAVSDEVGDSLTGVRAADRPVVLFRASDGSVVALEDRCAHRAYPLSAGTRVGDQLRCGLCGFVYDRDGQCVSVPTQPRVPLGAHVASYPVEERDGVVWAWFGEPGRARLHRVPDLPWLADGQWAATSGIRDIDAGFLLLHESFADVTKVPFVHPEIAPGVLVAAPPPLDVIVTETTVTLRREFPPAPLPAWQAELLGVGDTEFTTVQEGYFVSPAVWVDHWDVTGADGGSARLRFTHLVTPLAPGRTRLRWWVSRDFALDDASAGSAVQRLFSEYYSRVLTALEISQQVLDLDGPGAEVNVSSDVAALKVREIVSALLSEEGTAGAVPLHRRA
jgi:vanillate O-demethylase monooxygenase subunit